MAEQLELFRADTSWFHVFRAMIHSGACARMGPHAFTVYSVIKAHVDFRTGESFPSIDRIVALSGVSRRQVMRALDTLEGAGYISRRRQGNHNAYDLLERIPVRDAAGREVTTLTAPYIPKDVAALRDHIRAMISNGAIISGELQRVTINIQINAGNGIMVTG